MGAAFKMIEDEVFHKIESKKPGKLYLSLLIRFPISVIKTAKECHDSNTVLSKLIELTQKKVFDKTDLEQVNLYIQTLAKAVQDYETTQYSKTKTTGRDMLEHLMKIHGLNQSNLADELGGQSIVSSILKGKRELNKNQIQKLAKRFHVSVETFFDRE